MTDTTKSLMAALRENRRRSVPVRNTGKIELCGIQPQMTGLVTPADAIQHKHSLRAVAVSGLDLSKTTDGVPVKAKKGQEAHEAA